jgi:hypothetical protein
MILEMTENDRLQYLERKIHWQLKELGYSINSWYFYGRRNAQECIVLEIPSN